MASLAGKLLYDRAHRPRVWVKTAPFDPDLPIRGRYVRLQLEVKAPNVPLPTKVESGIGYPVVLRVEGNELFADPAHSDSPLDYYNQNTLWVRWRERAKQQHIATLSPPIAFFISAHVKDPSIRPRGEELWAEVTIPKKGPPRPIRLGVKRGDGWPGEILYKMVFRSDPLIVHRWFSNKIDRWRPR